MSDQKDESRPEDSPQTPRADEAEDDAETGPSGWAGGDQAADVEALQTETAELKDKLLRSVAEMENLRRRTEREKADTAKYAVSNFARDVLGVGDNMRRAIESVPEGAAEWDGALKSLLEGVEMTERELLQVLERHGITRLDPKGERFDPNQHQAMFEIEDKDVPAGTVAVVVQAGYVIADRVLRPAMVGVSKGGAKMPKAEATPEVRPDLPPAANDDAPEGPGETPKPGKDGDKTGARVDKSA